MKRLFILWTAGTLIADLAAPVPPHKVLKQDSPGQFTNYHFLVDQMPHEPGSIQEVASALVTKYCLDKQCNQLYFYKDEKAFDLLMYSRAQLNIGQFTSATSWRRANETWKRKNWRFICENIYAVYSGYGRSDLEFDPYLDSEYQLYGGQRKRPLPPTVQLIGTPVDAPDTAAAKDGGFIGNLFMGLAILVGFYYYYRRKRQNRNQTKPNRPPRQPR